MNTIHLFQEYVMYAALGGSLALLVGLIGYFMRNELRKFHLWVMHMPMLGKVIVFTGLAIGIVHGSTKTNLNTQAASPHAAGERFDLPSTPSAALQAANPNRSQVQPLPLAPERNRLAFVAGSEGDGATTNRADCLSACAAGTCVSNWTTRGAFLDWTRIEFPEGFSFPYGLERLSSVTLMSNGAIRTHLHNPAPIALLPLPVSVEPNVSSVTHGLTASNSYLFAWHDACVNREATNRTDAAIELFADGSISVRMDSPLLPTPHSLLPPAIPEGFVGHGQDEDWIRGNFALLQEMDGIAEGQTPMVGLKWWGCKNAQAAPPSSDATRRPFFCAFDSVSFSHSSYTRTLYQNPTNPTSAAAVIPPTPPIKPSSTAPSAISVHRPQNNPITNAYNNRPYVAMMFKNMRRFAVMSLH